MTTIDATINDLNNQPLNFGVAASELEVFIDGPVGSWKLVITDAADGSQRTIPGKHASIIGIDGATIIRGYVDKITASMPSEIAVSERNATIIGRNYARDLARLCITANFVNAKIGDIFDIALQSTGSEISCNPSQISTGPTVSIRVKNMYLLDLFEKITQMTGYGYTVNCETKQLSFWPLSDAPHTGVLLKMVKGARDNNILLINEKTPDGESICNIIIISGGAVNDHWTEKNATNWTVVNGTVTDDYVVRRIGAASIRVDYQNNVIPELRLAFPNFFYHSLDYSVVDNEKCTLFLQHNAKAFPLGDATRWFDIQLKDTENNTIAASLNSIRNDKWIATEFELGLKTPIGNSPVASATEGWQYINGSTRFNWQIKEIIIRNRGGTFSSAGGESFWVDGLTFPSIDAIAIVSDNNSITAFGPGMVPLSRPDLPHTMEALTICGQEEANLRKNYFDKVNITCKFQPNIRLHGLLVDLLIPHYGIGTENTPERWRIENIRVKSKPRKNLCRKHDAVTILSLLRPDQPVQSSRIRQSENKEYAASVSIDQRVQMLEEFGKNGAGNNGGGGSGGSFDGGVINQDLVVNCNMPFLNEADGYQVYKWLMTPDSELPEHSALIRFQNINPDVTAIPSLMQHLDLYAAVFSNGVDHNPGLIAGHHLAFRGDFIGRGMVQTYEGAFVAHGGRIPAGLPHAGEKVCGWAPTENPFMLLAQATINPNASTFEIRKGGPGNWGFGHLECNNLISHGFVGTNYLGALNELTEDVICYCDLVPAANNSYDLGVYNFVWRNLYAMTINSAYVNASQWVNTDQLSSASNTPLKINPWGGGSQPVIINGNLQVTGTITSDSGALNPFNQLLNTWNQAQFIGAIITGGAEVRQNLDVFTLRAYPFTGAGYSIGLASGLLPVSSGLDLGSLTNPFNATFANTAYAKNPGLIPGCARENSGKEWVQKIQNENEALNILTHEVTKTLKHITYSTENENEIVCTCGKSVKMPCPEHKQEWDDQYCKDLGKIYESTAFLTIEHAAKLARFSQRELDDANERIILLEKQNQILAEAIATLSEVKPHE